jgi:hypothetical protein
VGNPAQQLTPELYFYRPRIHRLAHKRRAVDVYQAGKPVAVMTLEVEKESLVCNQT